MAKVNIQQSKTSGLCPMVCHPIDICPSLQDNTLEQTNVVGGYQG